MRRSKITETKTSTAKDCSTKDCSAKASRSSKTTAKEIAKACGSRKCK